MTVAELVACVGMVRAACPLKLTTLKFDYRNIADFTI